MSNARLVGLLFLLAGCLTLTDSLLHQQVIAENGITTHELDNVRGAGENFLGCKTTPDTVSCYGFDQCGIGACESGSNPPPGCSGQGKVYEDVTIHEYGPDNNKKEDESEATLCWRNYNCVADPVEVDKYCLEGTNTCVWNSGLQCKTCSTGALLASSTHSSYTCVDP